ncbi:TadE/TadG family type IV pilus assembly protein [Brevundimonas bacteroides]|uniref:TadE/TadG family type IV pilus assembly protein n=1 Tax=Brevundimonas bacteroides TaxID=74311 RepID=UPI0004977A96|nr:pilus assembly protein TadG-related protein [Brevundimonas bacteroides]
MQVLDFVRRCWTDERGHVALITALALPTLTVLVAGAVDLQRVVSDRERVQDIADAAALAGASHLALAISDDVAISRVEAMIDAHLEEWTKKPSVTPVVQIVQQGSQRVMQVSMDVVAPSFFVNLLPPGGWKFGAVSRAVSVGMTPLCVLATSKQADKVINVKDSSRLRAPACMVHSNRDVLVEGGRIEAAMVQAVTSARGQISPSPGTGAADIPDPFADLALDERRSCSGSSQSLSASSGVIRLPAGVHCGGIQISGSAELTLAPGEHWFRDGHLQVKEDARLTGVDVVLFFDKASKFDFQDRALVNLDGRKTGPYAGLVMAATRDNTQDFIITSENVDRLLGVIYVPQALLLVDGKADVARESAWTVIVARSIQLKGSPSLIINANYGASDVPVPDGVGPRSGGARLIQ